MFSSSCEFPNIQSASQSAFYTAWAATDGWSLIWCPPTALDITRQPHHLPTAISLFWMWTRVAQSLKSDSVQPFWETRCDSKKKEKQPHSIWHNRVITGGRVLGRLYLVWGVERCCLTIWAQSCPPREWSHRSVGVQPSPLLTARQPLPCWLKINFAVTKWRCI